MIWVLVGAGWLAWRVNLALGVLGVLAAYGVACWWFPFVNCWCCRGGGKHRSKSGKTFRRCRVCGGRGSWFRAGRRVWTWFKGSG